MHGNSDYRNLRMDYFTYQRYWLIKEEISQWIMQKNKIFVFAQIQYKITNQMHGKCCPQHSFKKFYFHVSVVYTYEIRSQRKIQLAASEIMFHVIRDYNGAVLILMKSNLCTFLAVLGCCVYTFDIVSSFLVTILITIVTFQQLKVYTQSLIKNGKDSLQIS